MLWKLKLKNDSVDLRAPDVIEILIGKHLKAEREDIEKLALELASFIEYKQSMKEQTITQLMYLGFSLGYYYHVFKDKNSVEIINAESNNEYIEKPSSTGNNKRNI